MLIMIKRFLASPFEIIFSLLDAKSRFVFGTEETLSKLLVYRNPTWTTSLSSCILLVFSQTQNQEETCNGGKKYQGFDSPNQENRMCYNNGMRCRLRGTKNDMQATENQVVY
ncbi:hypothetical protein Bca4012_081968 [Brassica carinata]